MEHAELARIAETSAPGTRKIVCPDCSHMRRKKTLRDCTLTVEEDRALYFCHHCGSKGVIKLEDEPVMAVATPMEHTDLSDEVGKFLTSRSISRQTAEKAGCTETQGVWFNRLRKKQPALVFPYYNQGQLYASKLRSFPDKDFSANGSAQTLFNSHNITDWKDIILVEGEMDVLAMIEAGIDNAMSLPQGAWDGTGGAKLNFLKHHADDLETTQKCLIFTDSDKAGQTTANELARRIGRDRCWQVTLPEDCKDANDVLMKHGNQALRDVVRDAKPWPITGLHDATHYAEHVERLWNKGLVKGADTGLKSLDDLYSVASGQLTVVTGHPGSGKSELVDQIMVHLAETRGWKFAVCSFENDPRLHIPKLITKYVGAPFFYNLWGHRMTEAQREMGMDFVTRHFSFIHDSSGELTTLGAIIERLKAAVLRHGIRGVVIDPFNYIAKPKDVSETDWISQMLSEIRMFAQAHGIHVWFVAHPTKMYRRDDGSMAIPKGNDISGSAAWWAKADMGVTVHRPEPEKTTSTEVHVWKVRFSWTGMVGKADFWFDTNASRLVEHGDSVHPRLPPDETSS